MCENKATISYEDFCKLDLRVAKVIEAENHPDADKLICMKIDLGGEHRQIIAGLRGYYEPSELIGKEIVVVANLAPRKMRGIESHGMLLAASSESDGERSLVILTTEKPIGAGAAIS